MNSISEYIIAIFELAEAEGRTLKREIIRLLISGVLVFIAAFFLLGAYILLMYALHHYLVGFMTSYASGFVLSGISLGMALLLLGIVKWRV